MAADDRVLRVTRWLSIVIVPFLVAAFGITYLLPDRDKDLFAWNIQPRMTSMMLGAAYLGGVYFFTRAALTGRWHRIHVGFIPIAIFAGSMGVATLLHWDRFSHGHISFVTWVVLYFTTPFLVLAAWMLNRGRDPGAMDDDDLLIPLSIRWVIGATGAVTFLIAVWLFLQPETMARVWPWQLTPLTARVIGGLMALTGAEELAIALESRWSAVRLTLHSQLVAVAAIDLAVIVAWADFDKSRASTWIFAAGLFGLLPALAALITRLEVVCSRIRSARPARAQPVR